MNVLLLGFQILSDILFKLLRIFRPQLSIACHLLRLINISRWFILILLNFTQINLRQFKLRLYIRLLNRFVNKSPFYLIYII